MRDKIVLITGATSGIGKATALNLARRGATVVITCRNREKGKLTQFELINQSDNTNIHLLQADLSSQKEIINLTESFKNIFPRLDILINNAGTLGMAKRIENKSGHELTIATNYFSQFLMSYHLIDWLSKSEDARIINMSSATYKLTSIDWKDFNVQSRYRPLIVYGKSKLMITMFTFELAERLEKTGIMVNCVDPGTVYTNIAATYPKIFRLLYELGEPFMRTPEKGAETVIYLATDKKIKEISGKYFRNKKIIKPTKYSMDKQQRKKLWDYTIDVLGLKEDSLPDTGN